MGGLGGVEGVVLSVRLVVCCWSRTGLRDSDLISNVDGTFLPLYSVPIRRLWVGLAIFPFCELFPVVPVGTNT